MPTDRAILTLTQWFSPAYPVGAFAYSHGLEQAIDAGHVRDAATAQDWIATTMRHGAGRNDCLFIAAAFGAETAQDVAQIDATARAFAASAERLKESDLQGAAFCAITSAVWHAQLAGLCYPVAVGRAARLEGMPLPLTAAMYLQSLVANLAAVAMRLVPLGQTDGQRMIHALTPLAQDIAGQAVTGSLEDLGSSAWLGDIAAMKHETQYARIFRT